MISFKSVWLICKNVGFVAKVFDFLMIICFIMLVCFLMFVILYNKEQDKQNKQLWVKC